MLLLFAPSCGSGSEDTAQAPPPDNPAKSPPGDTAKDTSSGGGTKGKAPAKSSPGGSTVASGSQAESLKDSPFTLNQQQPVPPDFRAAYQRKALIVVGFTKENADSSKGIEYPQGLRPDDRVNEALRQLRTDYPEVEFFTYDISKPGNAESSEDLNRGEYGTLATQLGVGNTPFVAMLAPRGQGYVVENLFQGYVEKGVLNQALYDLVRTDVRGNSSRIDMSLERVELTESGDSIEYFTVTNRGSEQVDMSGFVLNVVDPATGDARGGSRGLRVDEGTTLAPGERASIGRASGIVDGDGREVIGTFGGGSLSVQPGDTVTLLDGSGPGGGAPIDDRTI